MGIRDQAYWIRSGITTIIDKIALQLLRFGSFYLLVRGLSKEAYGIWLLFLAICAFVEVARIGLIQNALVKYLAIARSSQYGKITSASLLINMSLTALSVTLLYGLSVAYPLFWELPLLGNLLLIYMITTVVLIPFFQFLAILMANMDFKGVLIGNLVREGLFFLYVLCCFFFPRATGGLYVLNLALFQIIAAFVATGVIFFRSWRFLKFSLQIERRWIRKLLNFGKFAFGTSLGAMILKTIDQLMLGVLISPVAVALYGICIKIANLVEIPTQALAEVVFPKSTQRIHEEGSHAARHLYERSVGAILALILPCILVVGLVPGWVIRVIAGESYLEAAPLLRWVLLYMLFVPFARQFGVIVESLGRPQDNFYFVVVGSLLNIIFNWLFITLFGLYGAVYGTLLSFGLMVLGNQIYLWKKLEVSFWGTWKHILGFYREFWRLGQGWLKKTLNQSEA